MSERCADYFGHTGVDGGCPGFRVIPIDAPNILQSLGPKSQRWILRVNAIDSGYWRVVGEAHDLIATAQRIGQQWVKGLGLARKIARIV